MRRIGVSEMSRRWVITTGKGDVYVTFAVSAGAAMFKFNQRFQGLEVASIIEATEF